MSSINTTPITLPAALALDSASDAGLSELAGHEQNSTEVKKQALSESSGFDAIADKQVLAHSQFTAPTAAQLESAIDAYQPDTRDMQDFADASKRVLTTEERKELAFNPGAWEKHANSMISAIIALNMERVTNAQNRGHFTVMSAQAAVSQGESIKETGRAAVFSAIANLVVSAVVAGFALIKTFQAQALKQTDISLHKQTALDANVMERDLKRDLARDDWNPETTYKIKTFDDFGRPTVVDFKPEGSTLNPQERAWFDAEILKAQNVGQTSEWLSAMSSKSIDKRLEIGRALNAISMSLSQVVTSLVRMSEYAAREQEVLQQSAQSTQKSLADEVGQKDSAAAALLQKIMDLVMQILQSRADSMRPARG
jgi:hypothetical protein